MISGARCDAGYFNARQRGPASKPERAAIYSQQRPMFNNDDYTAPETKKARFRGPLS
jgi:hypothetical protein